MRSGFLRILGLALVAVLPSAFAAPDRADTGHHSALTPPSHGSRPYGRPYPGPRGRDRFDRFDTFHNIITSPRRFRAVPYRKPNGWYYKLWGLGDIVPPAFITSFYWVEDYRAYELARPPFGCVWVRYGNDAILVDRRTGEVLRVVHSVFY